MDVHFVVLVVEWMESTVAAVFGAVDAAGLSKDDGADGIAGVHIGEFAGMAGDPFAGVVPLFTCDDYAAHIDPAAGGVSVF